ncbi:MAG: PD-(D/E)XK nuclease family protein [Candidatus Woesearchaeota archaeon]
MERQIVCNMSASSINQYRESQLVFYYQQILKAEPDTDVPTCYGDAGNVVHETLEQCKRLDPTQLFLQKWDEKNLDTQVGLNGKPLSKEVYYYAMLHGMELLTSQYNQSIHEEFIEFRIMDTPQAKINLKGFIDCKVTHEDGSVTIVDWKTNSSIKQDDSFLMQGKMYALLVYLKYGIVPKKVIFEYLKLKTQKEFIFTKEEILDHYKYILSLVREILAKGFDIEQYEIGNIDSPFNNHKKKCEAEIEKRFSVPFVK